MSPSTADAITGVPLTRLAEGKSAVVTALLRVEDGAAAHLVAVGVLPGAEIRLVQRYPSYIVEIGRTEFAVDEELAARIMVNVVQRAADNVRRTS